jgi:hypothetical protein
MANEFEERLNKVNNPSKKNISYSKEYQTFLQENKKVLSGRYEKFVNFSSKILKLKPSEKDLPNLQKYIQLAHLNIDPNGVMSLAILSAIPFFIFAIPLIFLGQYFFGFASIVISLFLIYYLSNMPKLIFESWRAKASDQLLIAVLYIVIYMKRDSNLERAILFVANQIPAPLSIDFIKILWDVETGKYQTIDDSLNYYIETWKDSEPAFVESIHLIQSSLQESDSNKAKKILEKATDVITTGVQDNLTHYAHNLQSPIQTVNMLGIVMPLLMLIMMPMVSAFLSDTIKPLPLIFTYNLFLPVLVFLISKRILNTRPGGVSTSILDKRNIHTGRLKLFSFLLFSIIAIPAALLLLWFAGSSNWGFYKFENSVFYISLLIIFALGLSFFVYYNYKTKNFIGSKKALEKIEDEFSSAIFQLGNLISQNIPTEAAFSKMVENTKGSEVNKFFSIIDTNIRQRGMNLEDSIFNKELGALNEYPSPLIESVMKILIESSKKGSAITADSMTTLSLYLQKMHQLKERMFDLLSDSLSSMKMQVSFLAPVMSALVVSLSVLVTKVLLNLSTQLDSFNAGDIESQGIGTGITNIFQVDVAVPPFILQLMIGIYIIQAIFLLTNLVSGIINGSSRLDFESMFSKNIIISTLIYCSLAFIGTFIFSQLAGVVTGVLA